MDFDDVFKTERYTTPALRREGEFVDRKQKIPVIQGEPKELADFVVDVIAMANMSYRFGRVGRILYGITDKGEIIGVEGQHTRKHSHQVDLQSESGGEKFFDEVVSRDFRWAAEKYIKPQTPWLHIQYGFVAGKLCAYLEIGANLANKQAYYLAQDIEKRLVQHTDDELEIVGGQIAARENQVYIGESLLGIRAVDAVDDHIADGQDIHV